MFTSSDNLLVANHHPQVPTRIAWSVLLKNRLALRLNRGTRIIRIINLQATTFFRFLCLLTLHKREGCTNSKKPLSDIWQGFWIRSLTMTYSHMGRPHTTIGAKSFHFWVRDGIRWFQLAMVVKQFWMSSEVLGCAVHQPRLTQIGWRNVKFAGCILQYLDACVSHKSGTFYCIESCKPFNSRFCYMVKPHEQLVLVSSTPRSASTPNLSTS